MMSSMMTICRSGIAEQFHVSLACLLLQWLYSRLFGFLQNFSPLRKHLGAIIDAIIRLNIYTAQGVRSARVQSHIVPQSRFGAVRGFLT